MKFILYICCLVIMATICQSVEHEPTPPPPSVARHIPDTSPVPMGCSQFKDIAIEDQYRRELGKERVFTKYCTPSAQTVVDNYCNCKVVPRFLDDTAFADNQSARSFLSTRTETKNVQQECCNEGCNLEEIIELAKAC